MTARITAAEFEDALRLLSSGRIRIVRSMVDGSLKSEFEEVASGKRSEGLQIEPFTSNFKTPEPPNPPPRRPMTRDSRIDMERVMSVEPALRPYLRVLLASQVPPLTATVAAKTGVSRETARKYLYELELLGIAATNGKGHWWLL